MSAVRIGAVAAAATIGVGYGLNASRARWAAVNELDVKIARAPLIRIGKEEGNNVVELGVDRCVLVEALHVPLSCNAVDGEDGGVPVVDVLEANLCRASRFGVVVGPVGTALGGGALKEVITSVANRAVGIVTENILGSVLEKKKK